MLVMANMFEPLDVLTVTIVDATGLTIELPPTAAGESHSGIPLLGVTVVAVTHLKTEKRMVSYVRVITFMPATDARF